MITETVEMISECQDKKWSYHSDPEFGLLLSHNSHGMANNNIPNLISYQNYQLSKLNVKTRGTMIKLKCAHFDQLSNQLKQKPALYNYTGVIH